MLWNASSLNGYEIEATDGILGSVSDVLFDDAGWFARWLVVETGGWLIGRKVLLPLSAVGRPDAALHRIPVTLTRQQVKDSPDVDTDLPVSRQSESHIYDYYGWDPYWGHGFSPISNAIASPFVPPSPLAELDRSPPGDPHLRSIHILTGYAIHATDSDIGHVKDFLIDDSVWRVRYLMVDTGTWWPGKRVLISPHSVTRIDWTELQIDLNVDRQKVKDSPPYNVNATVDGAYDDQFHSYYGILGMRK
jgi:uncharacterized protein YrrD